MMEIEDLFFKVSSGAVFPDIPGKSYEGCHQQDFPQHSMEVVNAEQRSENPNNRIKVIKASKWSKWRDKLCFGKRPEQLNPKRVARIVNQQIQ